jgi:hypothetical protein
MADIMPLEKSGKSKRGLPSKVFGLVLYGDARQVILNSLKVKRRPFWRKDAYFMPPFMHPKSIPNMVEFQSSPTS